MKRIDAVTRWCRGTGTEIGAFQDPLPGIEPIYVDKYAEYAYAPTRADYYGDAYDLPFLGGALDYVAASHVLEHTANPIAALIEWQRVLRPGGIAFVVVPDQRYTFDKPRPTTEPAHLLDDFRNGVTDADPSHIDEFAMQIDWGVFEPNIPTEQQSERRANLRRQLHEAAEQDLEINIHFHTFLAQTLKDAVSLANRALDIPLQLKVVAQESRFPEETPNGILLVLRKPDIRWPWKCIRARRACRNYPLRSDAKKMQTHPNS